MNGPRGPAGLLALPLTDEIQLPTADELERQFTRAPFDAPRQPPLVDATLTLVRNAPDDVQDRTVTLWLDEEPWSRLRYGQTLTRSIPCGRHRVRANNTLLDAVAEFDAAPGEHIHFRCANTLARGSMLLFWMIHWAAIRVHLERIEGV